MALYYFLLLLTVLVLIGIFAEAVRLVFKQAAFSSAKSVQFDALSSLAYISRSPYAFLDYQFTSLYNFTEQFTTKVFTTLKCSGNGGGGHGKDDWVFA